MLLDLKVLAEIAERRESLCKCSGRETTLRVHSAGGEERSFYCVRWVSSLGIHSHEFLTSTRAHWIGMKEFLSIFCLLVHNISCFTSVAPFSHYLPTSYQQGETIKCFVLTSITPQPEFWELQPKNNSLQTSFSFLYGHFLWPGSSFRDKRKLDWCFLGVPELLGRLAAHLAL